MIIGAGAAGLVSAIAAAREGRKVCIVEHTDCIGKKILATGNGKCNITNMVLNENCYKCEDSSFVMDTLREFDNHAVIDFFHSLGIITRNKNGYIYPNSEQAASIRDVLELECRRLQVTILSGTTPQNMKKEKELFKLKTDKGLIEASHLIIATGSKASPKTGSDGSGYEYAKSFGHTVKTPLPALTALRSPLKIFKQLSGVRCEASLTLEVDGKKTDSSYGELQLTDYGISGIPVFQISKYAVWNIYHKKKVQVRIDFLPSMDREQLLALLKSKQSREGYRSLDTFLTGIFNKKLYVTLLKYMKFDIDTPVSKLSDRQIEQIAEGFKDFVVETDGYNSFDYAQVCQGGIPTEELHAVTMESKFVKNLHFAGEIIDVDGICGGYNLQWAFSTGYLSGKACSND